MVGMNAPVTPADLAAIATRFHRLSAAFERTVAAVPADAWEHASPCAGWTARDVVGHVVDVHGMMLKPLGRTLAPGPTVAEDPLASFRAASAQVAAVVDDPATCATPYDGYFGPTTVGATIDRFMGLDLIVHRWDLARATGQDASIDAHDMDRVRSDVAALGDSVRQGGVFGPAVDVPEHASEQDRFLALLGRDPR